MVTVSEEDCADKSAADVDPVSVTAAGSEVCSDASVES